jgi:hypothetical protein
MGSAWRTAAPSIYVIDSSMYNIPGQRYSLNPRMNQITHVADLNTATGQGDMKAVVQGKVHVKFTEDQGKLYFSTHRGTTASGVIDSTQRPDQIGKVQTGNGINDWLNINAFVPPALGHFGQKVSALRDCLSLYSSTLPSRRTFICIGGLRCSSAPRQSTR